MPFMLRNPSYRHRKAQENRARNLNDCNTPRLGMYRPASLLTSANQRKRAFWGALRSSNPLCLPHLHVQSGGGGRGPGFSEFSGFQTFKPVPRAFRTFRRPLSQVLPVLGFRTENARPRATQIPAPQKTITSLPCPAASLSRRLHGSGQSERRQCYPNVIRAAACR